MAQYVSDISGGNPLTNSGGGSASLVSSPVVIGAQSLAATINGTAYVGDYAAVADASVTTAAGTDFEALTLTKLAAITNAMIVFQVAGGSRFVTANVVRGNSFIHLGTDVAEVNPSLGFSISDAEWYWLRLRKRAATLYAQCWKFGDPEPAGEAASIALSGTFTASSWLWGASNTSGGGSGTWYLNWISVGTAGDPAPRAKKTDLYVKDGGLWKPAQDLQVRDGGIWKPVQQQHVRDGGTWKKVYGS